MMSTAIMVESRWRDLLRPCPLTSREVSRLPEPVNVLDSAMFRKRFRPRFSTALRVEGSAQVPLVCPLRLILRRLVVRLHQLGLRRPKTLFGLAHKLLVAVFEAR